jgi:AcrR family transcriptional regulator
MPETRVGRRERNNQRTRSAITRAAAELILERGFDGATIAQIAERADVAPRTVHTWFSSKEAIILSGLDEPLDRLQAQLQSGTGDTVDRIERWLMAESEHFAAEDELGHLRRRALATDPHLRGLERERLDDVEAAVAQAVAGDTGAPADGLAAAAFAAGTIGLLLGLQAHFLDAELPSDPGGLADGLAVLRGAFGALHAHRPSESR